MVGEQTIVEKEKRKKGGKRGRPLVTMQKH